MNLTDDMADRLRLLLRQLADSKEELFTSNTEHESSNLTPDAYLNTTFPTSTLPLFQNALKYGLSVI
jgi:hypothetical protein